MCATLLVFEFSGYCGHLAIIELKQRHADEIIPAIEPFLGPGDTLSGQRYTIFLNTTPENAVRIQSIVQTLDKASRELMITVVQGENARNVLSSVDVSGNVSVGYNANITFGRHPQPEDSISVKGRSQQSVQRGSQIQQIRAREGMAATIFIGQSVPVFPREKGRRVNGHVGYQHIMTGFRVLTRLSDPHFVLDIASQHGSPKSEGDRGVGYQQIQTQIQGKLGEWLEIGGIFGGAQHSETGLVYSDSQKKENRWRVFLIIVEAR